MSDYHRAKIKKLHRLLKRRPGDRQSRMDLCLLHMKRREYAQALEQLRSIRKDPQAVPEVLDRMEAIISYSSGDLDRARGLFESLSRSAREDTEIEQYLARIAVNRGDLAGGIAHLEKALQFGGVGGELMNDLGVLYFLTDRYPEAEVLLRDAIRQDPQYMQAYRNLADLCERTKRVVEAASV